MRRRRDVIQFRNCFYRFFVMPLYKNSTARTRALEQPNIQITNFNHEHPADFQSRYQWPHRSVRAAF
jgi:hypothetical protein